MSGVTAAGVIAAATVVGAGVSVAGALGVFGGNKAPTLPTPQLPAQAATTSRNDTGSQIVVGADSVRNQRVSGGSNTNGGTQAQSTNVNDILGGLGAGGINI